MGPYDQPTPAPCVGDRQRQSDDQTVAQACLICCPSGRPRMGRIDHPRIVPHIPRHSYNRACDEYWAISWIGICVGATLGWEWLIAASVVGWILRVLDPYYAD